MKTFMNDNFLLSTECARDLYHRYAANMPIIDYHCHVSPKEIYEDTHFHNIYQVWLSGDHYKWRIMRSNGVPEKYITGDASEREKFQKFAEVLPLTIGNPVYHWCHLELKRYFGYEGVLNKDTAQEVWELTSTKLQNENIGVRSLITQSNVEFIGTTDDPIDSLEWHKKIMQDDSFKTVVAPSFRPDKALNIDKPGFVKYLKSLAYVTEIDTTSISGIKAALKSRIEYFNAHGCKASDHGLDRAVYAEGDAEVVLKKALTGDEISDTEAEIFKTELLKFCSKEYAKLGWVMQIHYNCLRNPNSTMFEKIGPDTGFDCIGPDNGSKKIALLLDFLYKTNSLPRTILYSLDRSDNAFLGTIIGAFQEEGIPGKIQHGSAWWFNDNKTGMREQLVSLANLSVLGNFIGMLTDSRSFLSYTRHEYFRRILCNLIGEWVENGEYPNDYETLGEIVQNICYNNAKKYFNLED